MKESYSKMKKSPLTKEISKLGIRLVRILNDTYIFIQESMQPLESKRDQFANSTYVGNRKYKVPTRQGLYIAKRNDNQTYKAFERFIQRELYENLIVTAVSRFEFFIFETLRIIISKYPGKLSVSARGSMVDRKIPLDYLIRASNLDDALEKVIEQRLIELSFASPREYLNYLNQIAGVDIGRDAFMDYVEIKATRDLIIHNSGIVNNVYIQKTADRKRAEIGELITIDNKYFDHCIATIKHLTRKINDDIQKTFK